MLTKHPGAQLAIDLNLNKSTISSIYRDLDEKGFIESLGDGETSETGGRKAKLIRFNRRYGYVISLIWGDIICGQHWFRLVEQ